MRLSYGCRRLCRLGFKGARRLKFEFVDLSCTCRLIMGGCKVLKIGITGLALHGWLSGCSPAFLKRQLSDLDREAGNIGSSMVDKDYPAEI